RGRVLIQFGFMAVICGATTSRAAPHTCVRAWALDVLRWAARCGVCPRGAGWTRLRRKPVRDRDRGRRLMMRRVVRQEVDSRSPEALAPGVCEIAREVHGR